MAAELELVLRCPDHPNYTGKEFPAHTIECHACARLSRVSDFRKRAATCGNRLKRQGLLAQAECESWPLHKRRAMNFERIR